MTTWILLRGLARERRHWARFPDSLRKEMPNVRVFSLDLPGNGGSNDVSSPLNVADMAEHCRLELVRHRISPPFCLLAISLGAMVAVEWARRHPHEIDACVLINTSFASLSPVHHRLRPRAWQRLFQLPFARSARRREEIVYSMTSRRMPTPPRLLEEWSVIRESRPVTLLNTLRQLVAAARYRAPVTAPVATLLLASSRDALVNPRCSKEIARRWNCPIEWHSEAGHDLPLDDPAWVARKIREWRETHFS